MRSIQVLVVGGGASGMMAAITAARNGARVLVLEKKKRLGRKLLATGNGRCNFTNKVQEKNCYRSSEADLPMRVIQKFSWEDSVRFFDEIGVLARNREGYYYPASNQAVTVLRALERELVRLGAEIHTEEAVSDVERRAGQNGRDAFLVKTDKGSYLAKKVILSTGGMAAPVYGSTGDGYACAKRLGHHVALPVPALTSLVLDGDFMKAWGGVRIHGKVSLYNDKDCLLCEDSGEVQMVSYGISGIPVFQVSHYAARELAENRSVILSLDSMPDYSRDWILDALLKRQRHNGEQSMGDLLGGMMPDKLAGVYLRQTKIAVSGRASETEKGRLEELAAVIKQMKIPVKAVSGFERAQVTAGGVHLSEVNPDTMESEVCRGLYLTGELLDVDGICGGYNLQWAWATGYLAGRAAGMVHGVGNRKTN